ncbi:Hypothetical predicted protein [Pelobates cultripes]|uniref:Uncharacterized protein n=1 Tax=Pelobates cultripes TaxID=61616 RepID=A0AAD1SFR0_PELCU|nr:Hypothetical predicted protein [Pelobates cultripes]
MLYLPTQIPWDNKVVITHILLATLYLIVRHCKQTRPPTIKDIIATVEKSKKYEMMLTWMGWDQFMERLGDSGDIKAALGKQEVHELLPPIGVAPSDSGINDHKEKRAGSMQHLSCYRSSERVPQNRQAVFCEQLTSGSIVL